MTPQTSFKGVAVLRQPGAVIVREFVEGRGPIMRRVELSGGVQPALGKEILFERLAGAYILTGGG